MLKEIPIKEISSKILSRPFWAIKELESELNTTEKEFIHILEELSEKYNEIGISTEIIELNSIDYLVVFTESEKWDLSNRHLGLLVVFGLRTKMEGGFLTKNSMNQFLNNYYNEIEDLIKKNLLSVQNNSKWSLSLTPLGALSILPYLEDSISIIQKLLEKRK